MLCFIWTSYYILCLSSLPLSFLFASCLFLSFSLSRQPPLIHLAAVLPSASPLHSLLPQIYLCLHIKFLFTFILKLPPSYLPLNIKLPVDFCLTCRIFFFFLLLYITEKDKMDLSPSVHCFYPAFLKWLCNSQEGPLHCLFVCLSHLQYLRRHILDFDSLRQMMHCTS